MRLPVPSSYSPQELDDGVDHLSEDPAAILVWSGMNRPRSVWDYAEIEGWRKFLSEARNRENERAPPFSDYIIVGTGVTAVVMGGVMLGAIATVPALIAAGISGVGALATIAGAVKLVRHNNRSNARLRAIEQAQQLLEARLRRHNDPPDN